MSDYNVRYQAWLEDVRVKGKTAEFEIKDIEEWLLKSVIAKLKSDITTQVDENKNIQERLTEIWQTEDETYKSIPNKYSENRGLFRCKALDAVKDSTVLSDLLKEVYNRCLRVATKQLTDLRNFLHPAEKNEKPTSNTSDGRPTVENLNNLKKRYPDIAALQQLTVNENVTNLINTFHSNKGSNPLERIQIIKDDGKEDVKSYMDSCIDLCWDMCSSNPVIYFIWEENKDTDLFRVDDKSDGKGDLKVVWPALVQSCNKGYKKLLDGLRQSTDGGTSRNKDTNEKRTNTGVYGIQTVSAAVSTTETTIHVPGNGPKTTDNVTESQVSKDQKKSTLQKTKDPDHEPKSKTTDNVTESQISKDQKKSTLQKTKDPDHEPKPKTTDNVTESQISKDQKEAILQKTKDPDHEPKSKTTDNVTELQISKDQKKSTLQKTKDPDHEPKPKTTDNVTESQISKDQKEAILQKTNEKNKVTSQSTKSLNQKYVSTISVGKALDF